MFPGRTLTQSMGQSMRIFVVGLFLATAIPVWAQTTSTNNPATKLAVEEAVRRQEKAILLRATLKQAAQLRSEGKLLEAARKYEQAWQLVQEIGRPMIEQEAQETIQGFTEVYLALAQEAYERAQYNDARIRVNRILRVNPTCQEAQKLKLKIEKRLTELQGRIPSQEALAEVPRREKEKLQAKQLVQDGKLLYELERYDEAEAKLKKALELDPQNYAAVYYLRLIQEARYALEARKRETMAKEKIVEVEQAWNPPPKSNLPEPNPFARTNIVHTGPGRRVIFDKMFRIRFDSIDFPGVSLAEVVKYLDDEVRARDPEGKGVNFLLAPHVDKGVPITPSAYGAYGAYGAGAYGYPAAGAAGYGGRYGTPYPGGAPGTQINPLTGMPMQQPTTTQQEEFDLANDVIINIEPPLRNIRLVDVLDAIIKVANHPIKYSVEEYGIIFSRRTPQTQQLFTRVFHVNPNAFIQGLVGVVGYQFQGYGGGYGGYGYVF